MGSTGDENVRCGGAESDDALLERLRRVLAAVDPVPETVVLMAQAAHACRDLDAQLVALVADSAAGLGRLALVRSAALAPRLLTFQGLTTALELELWQTRAGLRLQGQVVGGTRGAVVVEHGGGVAESEVDELGRFEADGLPSGTLRVRWVDGEGRLTTTQPFTG